MSLLMDALKKAELAKRKNAAANASAAAPDETGTESESHPSASKAGAAEESERRTLAARRSSAAPENSSPAEATATLLPPLPETLGLLDDEFLDASAAKPDDDKLSLQEIEFEHELQPNKRPSAGPAYGKGNTESDSDIATEREAVRNLFETKQTTAPNKTFAIVIGIVALLAAAGIGLYFWYQLQPQSGLRAGAGLNLHRPPPAPGIPISPAPAPVAIEPAIPELMTPEKPAATATKSETAESQPVRSPSPPPEKKLFRMSKEAMPRIDPALERGYAALNRGETDAARAAYAQALDNDPRNIDALSGMAVLARRSGDQGLAADYFQRILEADPHNAFAIAGLIGLQSRMNPAEVETRLKQALSTQPDSAALNFSLGNLYAASKRWPDAQQAYFKAVTADPGSPDYLFNLAVSLDQMRQHKLATNYYEQAVTAAQRRPGSFDKDKVRERLRKLQQQP